MYPYRAHFLACTRPQLPMAWETTISKCFEPHYVESLVLQTAAMDKGYDYAPTYEACHRLGIRPIIPLNQRGKSRDLHKVPTCTSASRSSWR